MKQMRLWLVSCLAVTLAASTGLAGLAATNPQAIAGLEEQVSQTSLSGSYLAAQLAAKANDDEAAVAYYKRSLDLDPQNIELKRLYFLALTTNGRIGDAVAIGKLFPADDEQAPVANLVFAVDALKRKD